MSSAVGPVSSVPHAHSPAAVPEPVEGKFAQRMHELALAQAASAPGPAEATIGRFLKELEVGQANLDRLTSAATGGKEFSNAELLALQASMYQYTISIELLSKVITQAVEGLKQLLKTQV